MRGIVEVRAGFAHDGKTWQLRGPRSCTVLRGASRWSCSNDDGVDRRRAQRVLEMRPTSAEKSGGRSTARPCRDPRRRRAALKVSVRRAPMRARFWPELADEDAAVGIVGTGTRSRSTPPARRPARGVGRAAATYTTRRSGPMSWLVAASELRSSQNARRRSTSSSAQALCASFMWAAGTGVSGFCSAPRADSALLSAIRLVDVVHRQEGVDVRQHRAHPAASAQTPRSAAAGSARSACGRTCAGARSPRRGLRRRRGRVRR